MTDAWPSTSYLFYDSIFFHSSTVGGKQEQAFLAQNPGYPAYTMDNCQLVDRQIQAVRWLNCSLIYFPPIPGTAFCSPLQTTKLYSNARQGTGRPVQWCIHCRVVHAEWQLGSLWNRPGEGKRDQQIMHSFYFLGMVYCHTIFIWIRVTLTASPIRSTSGSNNLKRKYIYIRIKTGIFIFTYLFICIYFSAATTSYCLQELNKASYFQSILGGNCGHVRYKLIYCLIFLRNFHHQKYNGITHRVEEPCAVAPFSIWVELSVCHMASTEWKLYA